MIITPKAVLTSLTYGSKLKIELICDYCQTDFKREFRRLNEVKKNSKIEKDACKKCLKLKNVEEFLIDINSDQDDFIIEHLIKNNTHELSGVYCIRNKKNNKSYIGSTKDLIKRWKSHIIELKCKNHYCDDFNNLDINDLEFILLEIINNANVLVEREYLYINLFKTNDDTYGYNIMSKTRYTKTNRKQSPVKLKTKLKRSNFTIKEIMDIKQSLASGEKIGDLASKYRTNYNTIQSMKQCTTWSDVLPELNERLIEIKYTESHKGENNPCSKLTEKDVMEIKSLLFNKDKSMTDIAKEYGVSRTLIGHIKRRKLWSHIS